MDLITDLSRMDDAQRAGVNVLRDHASRAHWIMDNWIPLACAAFLLVAIMSLVAIAVHARRSR